MEISDLKVKMDDLKISAETEKKWKEETRLHYNQRIKEKHAEFDQYRMWINVISSYDSYNLSQFLFENKF